MNRSTVKPLLAMAFITALSCSSQQPMDTEKAKMETTQNKNEGSIFPKGERAPADYFTGTVYLHMLAQKTESNHYSLSSVTFEPGARSNWHTHPAGQTLIVIKSRRPYQDTPEPTRASS